MNPAIATDRTTRTAELERHPTTFLEKLTYTYFGIVVAVLKCTRV
jgi:hypothetical protein